MAWISRIQCLGISVRMLLWHSCCFAQNGYPISGTILEQATGKPVPYATISLLPKGASLLSNLDGSFRFTAEQWADTLEISCVGYETAKIKLQRGHLINIVIELKTKLTSLKEVAISVSKISAENFMRKVIEHKSANNPDRLAGFSFRRYTRTELDIDNISFTKNKGNGMKGLLLKTYAGIDSTAKSDQLVPIYFAETIARHYHRRWPNIEEQKVVAKKSLGFKTDDFLSKLERFSFQFNVYDDWMPVFDQTYVSPLNSAAFNYYKYSQGDTVTEAGVTIQQVWFTPLHSYERAFKGNIWINTQTLALENVDMNLDKTANLNFIDNINYSEEYQQSYDSITGKPAYVPSRYSSEVKFESGAAILGVPVTNKNKGAKLIVKNTTVIDQVNAINTKSVAVINDLSPAEQLTKSSKPESFWHQNRSDSLTTHEKNIYLLADSLKANKKFQRNVKLMAFAGTGYWDFGKLLRVGTISSFISVNSLEGFRFRLGFWTMPALSKKVNLFGYGAYGTLDQQLKGMVGIKYLWNESHWTKTTLAYASDYDFLVDQDDEPDNDNLLSSVLRRNIPFTRQYVKQVYLKHEQYLSPDFTLRGSLTYKEFNPVFNFTYRPINPALDRPYDNVYEHILPVAEASVGIRYAHKEKTVILNYDKIRLSTFSPVFNLDYTYGFEHGNAEFEFRKLVFGVQQWLRLPPKCLLYYKIETGRIFGTLPYLLLNVPAGNEYYVASKYVFNTMAPYEFAADRYVGLHTRFYLGGALFDKIPLLQKLGWRERFSFNAYWGNMSRANIDYNEYSHISVAANRPFMEASAGIENIFHVVSIEYYRRLSYLNNRFAIKGAIYLGITLSF